MSDTTVRTDKRTFRARTVMDGWRLFWGLVDGVTLRCWFGMWFAFWLVYLLGGGFVKLIEWLAK